MLEMPLDPWEVRELAILEHLGITGRERRAAHMNLFERLARFVQQRNEYRIGARSLCQGLQAVLDTLREVIDAEILKVDSDLGPDEIESRCAQTRGGLLGATRHLRRYAGHPEGIAYRPSHLCGLQICSSNLETAFNCDSN